MGLASPLVCCPIPYIFFPSPLPSMSSSITLTITSIVQDNCSLYILLAIFPNLQIVPLYSLFLLTVLYTPFPSHLQILTISFFFATLLFNHNLLWLFFHYPHYLINFHCIFCVYWVLFFIVFFSVLTGCFSLSYFFLFLILTSQMPLLVFFSLVSTSLSFLVFLPFSFSIIS